VARLTDSIRLQAYCEALSNWRFAGYVQFELSLAAFRWVSINLEGLALKELGRLMHEHVLAGGEIDEVAETRPEWRDKYAFHYDLRFVIDGQPVYLETRLNYRLPLVNDESWILVVNIHAP